MAHRSAHFIIATALTAAVSGTATDRVSMGHQHRSMPTAPIVDHDGLLRAAAGDEPPIARVTAARAELSFERQEAFFNQPDAPMLEALQRRAIRKVTKGRGGRSLGFRIVLEGGAEGYFKPEQTFSAANWFGEVAAFHLDRMLGLGRVPAAVSRVLPWEMLAQAAGSDRRKSEVIVRDGKVRGAFVAWVKGPLTHMEHQERWEPWLRLTRLRTAAVSPFQRPAVWQREVLLAKRLGRHWRSKEERARLRRLHPEPVRADRPGELSDLIVFDYLTKNLDRWSSNHSNLRIRGAGGPLVFLDNGAGFEPGDARPVLAEVRLAQIERFRPSTIAAVKAFDPAQFAARLLAREAVPVLDRAQLAALAVRRNALLERVAHLLAMHGEAVWIID